MNMTSKIVKIMKWPQIDQIPSKIHVLEFIFIFLNTLENGGKKQVMTFIFHVKEFLLENNFQ